MKVIFLSCCKMFQLIITIILIKITIVNCCHLRSQLIHMVKFTSSSFLIYSVIMKHYIMKTGKTQKLLLKSKTAKFLIIITIFIIKLLLYIYIYIYIYIYKATMIANNFIVVIYVGFLRPKLWQGDLNSTSGNHNNENVSIYGYIEFFLHLQYIFSSRFLHLQYILSTILHVDIVGV